MRRQPDGACVEPGSRGFETRPEEPGSGGWKPVGVLLCLESRLLRGLTRRALSRVPGIRVVGDCPEVDRIQAVIDREGVDWVIIGAIGDRSLPEEEARVLLNRNPTLSLLEIAPDGGSLKGWWFSLHEETICGPTLDDIVTVLRSGFR